jgi:hypothetical protein
MSTAIAMLCQTEMSIFLHGWFPCGAGQASSVDHLRMAFSSSRPASGATLKRPFRVCQRITATAAANATAKAIQTRIRFQVIALRSHRIALSS